MKKTSILLLLLLAFFALVGCGASTQSSAQAAPPGTVPMEAYGIGLDIPEEFGPPEYGSIDQKVMGLGYVVYFAEPVNKSMQIGLGKLWEKPYKSYFDMNHYLTTSTSISRDGVRISQMEINDIEIIRTDYTNEDGLRNIYLFLNSDGEMINVVIMLVFEDDYSADSARYENILNTLRFVPESE